MENMSALPGRWADDPATMYLTGDRVIRVEGAGGRDWLNSLLTADIRAPSPAVARYGLFLNAGAGIVSDAWIVECQAHGGASAALAVVVQEPLAECVYDLLQRYLFDEKIAIDFDPTICVVSILGPAALDLAAELREKVSAYSCDRLGFGGVDVWLPVAQGEAADTLSALARVRGVRSVNRSAWEATRIALGVPRAGAELDESSSPHEAGIETRAVSFSKGCYIGQERVGRQQRRKDMDRRLVQLEIEGGARVPVGSGVVDPLGANVGRVTSMTVSPRSSKDGTALGYVKANYAQPGVRLVVDVFPAYVAGVVGQSEFRMNHETPVTVAL